MKHIKNIFPSLIFAIFMITGCTVTGGVLMEREPVIIGKPVHVKKAPMRNKSRSFNIPPGHMPPPGSCRIWYQGIPPGKQPPPGNCYYMRHQVPLNAILIVG